MSGLAAELRGARLWMKDATAMFVWVLGTWPYTCRRSNTMYGLQHVTNTVEIQAILALAYTPLLPWQICTLLYCFWGSQSSDYEKWVFWIVTPHISEKARRFGGTSPLHSGSFCLSPASYVVYSSFLKMEAVFSSEKSVAIPDYTAYITEIITLHGGLWEPRNQERSLPFSYSFTQICC